MRRLTRKIKRDYAKYQRLTKIVAVFSLVLLVISVYNLINSNKKMDCEKWLFYKSTGVKAASVEAAIEIFRPFLKTENKYIQHELPATLAGFKEKYNLEPYLSMETVKNKKGKFEVKEVYNMLLAYLIDRQGNIYKYNMCGLL